MLYHWNPITNVHCFTQLLDFTDYCFHSMNGVADFRNFIDWNR